MNVQKITYQPNKAAISFKQNYKNIGDFEDFTENIEPENFTCGYDDTVSQKRRELIRENIIAQNMPYYSYHSQARTNPQEIVNQIAKEQGYNINATAKKADVDADSLERIWNFRPVEFNKNNGFRGSEPKASELRALKNAGVERIISLNSPTYGIVQDTYTEKCNGLGLEHIKLYIPYQGEGFPTVSKKDLPLKDAEERTRDFIDNMIKAVEGMRKGYFYIHCDNGTTKTNNALYMLMVLSDLEVYATHHESGTCQNMIKNIREVLNDEDKEKLNYGANL